MCRSRRGVACCRPGSSAARRAKILCLQGFPGRVLAEGVRSILVMASGSRDLGTSVLDVGACDRIGSRIEARERRRSVEHAEQLTDLLALRRVHEAAGMGSA